MYSDDHDASPVNPLPPVVVALAAAIMLIELGFQAGARGLIGGPEAVGWRQAAVQHFGFWSSYFQYLAENGIWRLDGIWRFFSYSFLHYSMTHAMFASVLVLALGNVTAKVFAAWAQIAVFLASSAAGAVVYGMTSDGGVLFGAYPAVYGLLGLYTWALWVAAVYALCVLGTGALSLADLRSAVRRAP